ncbi:unnamed protein product, partial [Urochloa humidicola]
FFLFCLLELWRLPISLLDAVIPQVRVKRPRRPLSCGNSRVAFVNYNDKEVLCNNYLFHNDLRTKFTPNVLGVKLEMLITGYLGLQPSSS